MRGLGPRHALSKKPNKFSPAENFSSPSVSFSSLRSEPSKTALRDVFLKG